MSWPDISTPDEVARAAETVGAQCVVARTFSVRGYVERVRVTATDQHFVEFDRCVLYRHPESGQPSWPIPIAR